MIPSKSGSITFGYEKSIQSDTDPSPIMHLTYTHIPQTSSSWEVNRWLREKTPQTKIGGENTL